MFFHNINPVLLNLGPFEIRYYGLFYALGFIIAYFLISYLAKRRNMPITKDDVADFIIYQVIGVVLGARIVYVIFYNPVFYFQDKDMDSRVKHRGNDKIGRHEVLIPLRATGKRQF